MDCLLWFLEESDMEVHLAGNSHSSHNQKQLRMQSNHFWRSLCQKEPTHALTTCRGREDCTASRRIIRVSQYVVTEVDVDIVSLGRRTNLTTKSRELIRTDAEKRFVHWICLIEDIMNFLQCNLICAVIEWKNNLGCSQFSTNPSVLEISPPKYHTLGSTAAQLLFLSNCGLSHSRSSNLDTQLNYDRRMIAFPEELSSKKSAKIRSITLDICSLDMNWLDPLGNAWEVAVQEIQWRTLLQF